MVVVEKVKDAISKKGEIYKHGYMSKKSSQDN